MTKVLENKVALITGASRGIGAAIATKFAEEGASVAVTYANGQQKAAELVKAIEAAGGKAIAIQADNADASAVRNAVNLTAKTFGGLDILVNNAGLGLMGPLDTFSLEDFDRISAVNVRAVFVATQEAAKHMKAGGRVITVGSCMAERAGFPGATAYTMTKAAVVGMTRGLAYDLGPRGITANVIQPGPIDTEMNPANGPNAETMKSMLTISRFGTGDEVAGLALYLASDIAGFVNGAAFTIDGGFRA